jgi:hypothetical protein
MITIQDNDHLWRAGKKIGHISGNDVYDYSGKKIGYFEDNDIYSSVTAKRLAYIRGNEVYSIDNTMEFRLDENHKHVVGGVLSDIARAAARVLLGD